MNEQEQDMRQPGVPEEQLTHVVSHRATGPIEIDGNLEKLAWKDVPRSPRFVDMVSGEPALYETRMATQWDDDRFYVAYWVLFRSDAAHEINESIQ